MNVKMADKPAKKNLKKGKNNSTAATTLDYEKLVNTPEFKSLVKRKNGFLAPYAIFFTLIYGLLPILTSYTTILEKSAIGPITWTWMYSFSMFIVVWTLSTIYTRKAARFDKDVEEILRKNIIN